MQLYARVNRQASSGVAGVHLISSVGSRLVVRELALPAWLLTHLVRQVPGSLPGVLAEPSASHSDRSDRQTSHYEQQDEDRPRT